MTEARLAWIGFGFDSLRLHRIYGACLPENEAYARVMEKVGMRREGHQRESCWMKGRWVDFLQYAILEREWQAAIQ